MDDQEYLRDQIHNSLSLRETEDLIEIWQTHDSHEWTDLAFDVVKDILRTRLGELPSPGSTIQNEPANESATENKNSEDEKTLPDDEPLTQSERSWNIIREFSQAYNDTYKLQKRYYWLTTGLGLVGVLVGSVLAIFATVRLAMVLDQPNDPLWIGVFLVIILVVICLSTVLVAALFSIVMVCLGKFTLKEAIRYSCLLGYPRSWFKAK